MQEQFEPYLVNPQLSVYRRVSALAFDLAARQTGLTPIQLRMKLRSALLRPTLTAPTLRAWRRGTKPVPAAVLLATCDLAGKRPAQIFAMLQAGPEAADLEQEAKALLSRL